MNTVRLSKVAKIDRTVASKADCQILPYVGLEHLEKESGQFIPSFRPRPDTDLLAAKFKFTPKHILYGKLRPYLNKVTAPTFSGVCTTEILPILVDDDQLSRGYLYAILRSPTFVNWASAAVSGANLPRLDPKQLAQYEIPFPSLPEQKRIAAILDKADRLRRQRRFAQTLSDSFLQSVFIKMFGESFDGSSADIPLVPLETVCNLISDGTHHTPTYLERGVAFLSVKNVSRPTGKIDFSDIKFISQKQHDEISKRSKPEMGDILYTKIGATYGVAKTVETNREFSIFVSLALLKPKRERILPKYLESVMNSRFVKRQADNLVSGIGVPDLHLREIKTFRVPLPEILLQEKFVAIVQKFERIRRQQREATRQAEHLFQTLLHRAFRGEL